LLLSFEVFGSFGVFGVFGVSAADDEIALGDWALAVLSVSMSENEPTRSNARMEVAPILLGLVDFGNNITHPAIATRASNDVCH